MTKLYLAHPIVDRHWIRELELQMEGRLGIELVNPFYDDAERDNIQQLDAGMTHHEYDKSLDPEYIVKGDLAAVERCDGCLVFVTDKASVGIYMELFHNSYNLHKPAYLIVSDEHKAQHPWLRYMATKIFRASGEFEEWWKMFNFTPKSPS